MRRGGRGYRIVRINSCREVNANALGSPFSRQREYITVVQLYKNPKNTTHLFHTSSHLGLTLSTQTSTCKVESYKLQVSIAIFLTACNLHVLLAISKLQVFMRVEMRLLMCGCGCVCGCGCGVPVSMPCGRCAEISLYCVYRCCIDLPIQTPRTMAAVWYKLLQINFRALTDQFY